jgi:hypothetical protein
MPLNQRHFDSTKSRIPRNPRARNSSPDYQQVEHASGRAGQSRFPS